MQYQDPNAGAPIRTKIPIRQADKLPQLVAPGEKTPSNTNTLSASELNSIGESSSASKSKRRKIVSKRLVIQLTFIFVHVALIKFAIPNILWAVLGLAFWGGLVYAASRSGRWVCASFCWLGGIQDLFYGFAKKRVSFNPKISQYITLFFLIVWVPLAWFFHSSAITDMSESPINNPITDLSLSFTSPEMLLMQFGHFAVLFLVGLSVAVFGARGACHYFCPFGIAVGYFKNQRLVQLNLKK
ncbi:MAG: 4Fe-4S binding protein [Chloroherpetonaceae bacterium]|nr:4Fe-4S binding protein [Chloroherpetonaceae bacterium]